MSATNELPEGDLVDYILEFNSNLRALTLKLTLKFPDDPDMTRAQKRVLLAVRDFPEWVVSDVGMHMYKYRKQIIAGDTSFFLENDYDGELRQAAAEDPEKAKLTALIIPRLKAAWKKAGAPERAELKLKAENLLYAYIDYRLIKTHESGR
jgi:hypothetical protein